MDNTTQDDSPKNSKTNGDECQNTANQNGNQGDTNRMKNDLLDSSDSLGPNIMASMKELSKYKFERAKAEKWALMDIKFLVFDDAEDTEEYEYDSDDEEGMLEHAVKMSYGNGGITTNRQPGNSSNTACTVPSESFASSSSSSKHIDEEEKFSCRVCGSYPEFPHQWKPRKFRLVQPTREHPEWFNGDSLASVDICMHYVAVSYCWPPREVPEVPRRYQVRDLDGTVRPSRALDDVLDRAVDFANSCGLRMIWIDQECLPQPAQTGSTCKDDWDEQEIGIQSMDIVYNRAMVTAGLLDVHITSQEQLSAIEALAYFEYEQLRSVINIQLCNHVLDFLHKLVVDRWYTRAWVVQESLCAGEKLMLAFRRSPGVAFPSKFRYGYQAESETRPYHSLDNNSRGLESNIACIRLGHFWRLLDRMKNFLVKDYVTMGNQLLRYGFRPRDLFHAADALHPRTVKANDSLQQNLKIYGGGHYGKRPTINAAGALTLLKHRQCYFDSDRLAIIANMCDYDFRLDTRAVDSNCPSLRLAILALALNNGDMSLLAPEAYLPWNHTYSDDSYEIGPEVPVLLQNFVAETPRIDHCRVRDFINIRLQTVNPASVTSTGLLLHSYLWSVDKEIDFTPIQARWADQWENIRCWRMILDRQKTETQEQFKAREVALSKRISQPGVSKEILREFRRLGHVPHNSLVWGSIDSAGVQMLRHVDSKRIKREPGIRDVVADVIFDILRYMLCISDQIPQAKGLANSVWQSIRIDQVPGSEEPLPDEVGGALFRHNDIVKRPFDTLQLDETLDGSPAQLWFVDRIMATGTLWCGTYLRPGRRLDDAPHPSSHPSTPQEDNFEANPDTDESSPLLEKGKQRRTESRSIIQKQIARQMLTGVLARDTSKFKELSWRHPTVALVEIAQGDYWTERGEQRREKTLVSTFDVDGPCVVATPYNAEWEILPRPELRSMSVCWVVEPMESGVNKLVPSVVDATTSGLQGQNKGKGKRKASEISDTVEDSNGTNVDRSDERFGDQGLNCVVLRKVKGLWQIMDLPSQQYVFS